MQKAFIFFFILSDKAFIWVILFIIFVSILFYNVLFIYQSIIYSTILYYVLLIYYHVIITYVLFILSHKALVVYCKRREKNVYIYRIKKEKCENISCIQIPRNGMINHSRGHLISISIGRRINKSYGTKAKEEFEDLS